MNPAQLINQTSGKTSGVYRIRNLLNERIYIGSAVDLRRRFKDHRVALRKGNHHCQHLQRAWEKYGEEAFVFEILEFAEPDALTTREQIYLDQFEFSTLYNACPVAYSHQGVKRSDETKKRMSEAARTRKRPPPHTDEHKAKISMALRGLKRSPETIAKSSRVKKGKKLSPEHVEKMRAARKGKAGKKHTEETKRRIGETHKGMTASAEARAKMSAAATGRTRSAETRARMSAAQRARREGKGTGL